ncbi:MAG TPA: endolytic transglycosylase MltG [Hyphomicrobium sp.]|jgi:UPF0755 protein
MLFVGGTAFIISNQFESPGPLDAPRTVVIPKGEGRIAIAERLEKEGVITNRWTFVGGYLLQGFLGGRKTGELRAGEYEIKEHASMRDVIDTLAEGKSILYKATLPEGLTSEQIVERLKAEPNLSGEIATIPPEGSLLPDTYYFSKGASRSEILDRMRNDMQKAMATLWDDRDPDLPVRSVEELVTFASIVEKETGRPDERDRVAAVFYNRLKKSMRLQSDPTIIYGIVGGQGILGRSITKADIDAKSPYNTYQINGLPPGPICNPGKSAILAALHPAKTADLYFVADGSGGHTFSETLKEHNSAVQKWRAVEKQSKAKQGAGDTSDQDADTAPIPQNSKPGPVSTKTQKSAKAAPLPAAAGDGDSDDSAPGTAAPVSPASTDMPLPVRKPKRQ